MRSCKYLNKWGFITIFSDCHQLSVFIMWFDWAVCFVYHMYKPIVTSYCPVCLHCGSVSGSHKDTETLIRWRMAHGYLFSGWRNTCRNGWEYVSASNVHVVCILIFFDNKELSIKGFSHFFFPGTPIYCNPLSNI